MSILQATSGITGLVGVQPSLIFLNTNDTLATVTTAGYLTNAVKEQLVQINVPTATNPASTVAFVTTTTGAAILTVQVTGVAPNLVYSLVQPVESGQIFAGNVQAGLNGVAGGFISYPAALNTGHMTFFATAQGGNFASSVTNAALGQATTFTIPDPGLPVATFILSQNAGTQTIATGNLALSTGTLSLGSSGHASSLTLFPATAANGTLIISPLNAGGAFNTTVRNSAMGQSSVISIPDPGVAATTFLLADNAAGQTIATGNLSLSLGTLTLGSSGHASSLTLFPGTAANGTLLLVPVNAGGAFNTTISNGTMGQTSVLTIPDPGNAIGRFLVAATATPFTANHSLVASGTGGLIADAGYQMKSVAQAAVAGGAAAQTVVDAFCTAASNVIAVWNDTTNAVTIQKVAAGVGQFVVTSSGDPGASHINYIITKV